MKTALVVAGHGPADTELAADLAAVGFRPLGTVRSSQLLAEVVRQQPDVVACHDISPDDAFFSACALLASAAPCPVAVFTQDPDATKMARALESGVHAYVVNGYGRPRLRAVLQLAEARFRQERALQERLDGLTRRFDERKLVDRAKGILMRARQVSEEEAFRTLRSVSMQSQRRVGQVSRQVIDAAHFAEAVNRAGKLRMLSQRVVKLCALQQLAPAEEASIALQLDDTVRQIEALMAELRRRLSPANFGDLLEAVASAWQALQAPLALESAMRPLNTLDRHAEHLLNAADQLTEHLEAAGLVTTLHVINVSGRQRMLSQRCAKQALLGVLLDADGARAAHADLEQSARRFEAALEHLRGIPLTTREIRETLEAAQRDWAALARASSQARTPAGQRALAETSETLVAHFDLLTDHYERSMQVLMG